MQKNRIITLVGLIIILAIGYFIYNSNSSQTKSNPQKTQQTTESSPSAETKSAPEIVVEITRTGFSPQEITITKGATVTWINKDTILHDVSSDPHPKHTDFPLLGAVKNIKAGEKKSFIFYTPGTYKYHDHLEPSLKGTVIVNP